MNNHGTQRDLFLKAERDVAALERKHSALMQVIRQVQLLAPLYEAVTADDADDTSQMEFHAALERCYRMWVWLRDNEPLSLDVKAR